VNAFKSPTSSLGNLDAEAAATLIAAAADVTLILDAQGVIRDLAFQSPDLAGALAQHPTWIGQKWTDIVTVESRAKVEAMLRGTVTGALPRWRHLNHPVAGGPDVAVLYSLVQLGGDGRVVAFGRDLRAVSTLQQRLIDAQQSLERDYSRIRHVETRYRLLFQMASDAVLILDGTTRRVIEGNPASRQILGEATSRGQRRALAEIFDAETAPSIEALLDTVRASGRADDVRARLAPVEGDTPEDGHAPEHAREVLVSASLFREEAATLFLLRIALLETDPATTVVPKLKSKLIKLMESAPDAFVVTSTDGRIITANLAFLEMAQLPSEEPARGEPLDRWLGRPGVDLDVLIANLRQRGTIRLFATALHGEFGVSSDVEVSAAAVMNGGQPCYGFAIRDVGRRLSGDAHSESMLPRSLGQITELIGRVGLKDLVREATDVVERLCIKTALELTDDNRASAAEMLGLSRQSLYVKLRRHGLDEPEESGS
jgi:transcriptional regulator PpsR